MSENQSQIQDHKLFLAEVLAEKRRKNPAFSLRAFSRHLEISPATLSQVIAGKRPLTFQAAVKIADRLGLDPSLRSGLLRSAEVSSKSVKRDTRKTELAYDELSADTFRAICDWYHYGILGLASLRENRADPEWIAKRLGISKRDARSGLNRLQKLGLLEVTGASFRQTSRPLSTSQDISSSAIRQYHYQTLEKAMHSLETVPVELRDFSAITMATDTTRLQRAKTMIKRFRRQLCKVLETDETNEVYTLSVQLFPISRATKRKDIRK